MLLSHTNLSYEDIGKRTIRQINIILANLPEQLCIKLGVSMDDSGDGSIAGSGKADMVIGTPDNQTAPKLSELFSVFGGEK